MSEERYCKQCGEQLEEDEFVICDDCADILACNIIWNPNIPPEPGDFT